MPEPLRPADLRPSLPPDALPFEDLSEVEPSDAIVGQPRALAAIRQAVHMERPGYNLFVVGLDSGGRLQTVRRILGRIAPRRRRSRDFVFVHRHDDPSRPQLLSLPPGAGPRLQKAVLDLREALFAEIPRILDSDLVRTQRDRIVRDLERQQRDVLLELQEAVRAEGFELGGDEDDEDGLPVVVLVTDDGPVGRAEAHLLAHQGEVERDIDELEALFDKFEDALARTLSNARRAARSAHKEVVEVEQEAIRAQTQPLFDDVARRFRAARRWVSELHDAVVEHLDAFRGDPPGETGPPAEVLALISAFTVNVFHRGSRSRRAPVIVVPDPTFGNLFGGIVTEGPLSGPADHSHLRAGALHDADGGFLVVNANDLLTEPGTWKTLKRAMTFGELGIHNLESALHGQPPQLRPHAVPLDVKVVLLGDEAVYAALSDMDQDFASIFKIRAEFEDAAPLDAALAAEVTGVLARLQQREGIRPLTRPAMEELLIHGLRESGLPGRVTLHIGALADVMREADFVAAGPRVDAEDVRRALEVRAERHGALRRHIADALDEQRLHVATSGTIRGQVNGLAVLESGGAKVGRPLRITATAGAQPEGELVNIEREAFLSGPSHDKGVLVVAGLLRARFGHDRTLAVRASIAIEEHHGGIDGDSASAAELIALLSAIGALPIRQDRAITGSIDQTGAIRPIGGVNEKIEAFHALCARRGLTGTQGVLIPAPNVAELCLHPRVVADCAAGRFHIWPVATLEDALSLLTDLPAGDPQARRWPDDTVHGRVHAALGALERVARRPEGRA